MLELDEYTIETTAKFLQALKDSEYTAAILTGSDNVQYAGCAFMPFLPYREDMRVAFIADAKGHSAYVCPEELASSFRELGSAESVYAYQNTSVCFCAFTNAIRDAFKAWNSDLSVIAIDADRCSHSLYTALEKALSGSAFAAADQWISALRQVKTENEQELLGDVSYAVDHAINGQLHHLMGWDNDDMLSMAEEFRVHALERGIYETGYNSLAHVSGHERNEYHWPMCPSNGFNFGFSPAERLHNGDLIKVRMDMNSQGYWSNASRMFCHLRLNDHWKEVYGKWFTMRNFMLSLIRDGVRCDEVYAKTMAFAAEKQIALDPTVLLGHSVGVTPEEAPFIDGNDTTTLREGMIIVISPAILDGAQSFQGNDTLKVTVDGAEVLNWWKDWREPYIGIADL